MTIAAGLDGFAKPMPMPMPISIDVAELTLIETAEDGSAMCLSAKNTNGQDIGIVPPLDASTAAGASIIAVDSPMHDWLHRTGSLRELGGRASP